MCCALCCLLKMFKVDYYYYYYYLYLPALPHAVTNRVWQIHRTRSSTRNNKRKERGGGGRRGTLRSNLKNNLSTSA